MSETPDITVVVPCRNERRTLGACLDALDAQDLPRERFEVLVVDGRSTDGCREVVNGRQHRLLDDPGRGPSAARNLGIWGARAPIVAFTDADCVPRFDWLSRIQERFRQDASLAGVAGAMRMPRHTLLGRLEDNDARLRYHGYITSNVAYRRDVLLEVGGFDEELSCAEDYDLAWRVLDRGYRIARDDGPVVLHDPPELHSIGRYLAKQFWYARHDVPTHARALARALRTPDARAGSGAAVGGGVEAIAASALVASAAWGAASGSARLAAVGLGAAVLRSVSDVASNVARIGEGAAEVPAMAAIQVAKSLTRGAGTLAGVADLAHPARWRYLSAAPARAPSPRPSARGAPLAG